MSQTNEVFIVTGCSRGVGAALFQMAGRAGRRLLGIARHVRDEGLAGVSVADPMRESWAIDLRDSARVVERLRAWLLQSDRAGAGRWVLINNAALLEPPGDLARQSVDQTSAVLRVGVEAPMLLTATLLSVRDEIGRLGVVPRVQIMNISSGLGRRAMAGTAAYCAAKAGLDHFSRALALEESAKPNGARVVSIAPGVIDTAMQQQLRSASAESFAAQKDFASLHVSGSLTTPEDTAKRLLAWLERPDFGEEVICDIRRP